MNANAKWKNRVFTVVSIAVVTTLVIVGFRYGKPWLRYHQQHLVLYDCQLKSETTPVGALESGRIASLYVKVGDRVAKGDVIARMECQALRAKRAEAEEAIQLAVTELGAKRLSWEKEIETMESMIEGQKAKEEISATEWSATQVEKNWLANQLEISRKLAKRGSVSQFDWQKIARELKQFESKSKIVKKQQQLEQEELKILTARLAELKAKSGELDVLKHKIAMARRTLEIIDQSLATRVIKAELSGVVTDIYRGAGSSVSPGDPIVQLQGQQIWAEVWVDESQLADVGRNLPVTIFLKAYPDEPISGYVAGYLPSPMALERSPQLTENPILQSNAKICVQICVPPRGLPFATGIDWQSDRKP